MIGKLEIPIENFKIQEVKYIIYKGKPVKFFQEVTYKCPLAITQIYNAAFPCQWKSTLVNYMYNKEVKKVNVKVPCFSVDGSANKIKTSTLSTAHFQSAKAG